jgi:hypothetical protein
MHSSDCECNVACLHVRQEATVSLKDWLKPTT